MLVSLESTRVRTYSEALQSRHPSTQPIAQPTTQPTTQAATQATTQVSSKKKKKKTKSSARFYKATETAIATSTTAGLNKPVVVTTPTAGSIRTAGNLSKGTANKTAKPEALKLGQVILIARKGANLPEFDVLHVRNQLNTALQKPCILKVEKSSKGNVVLTTRESLYPAKAIIADQVV